MQISGDVVLWKRAVASENQIDPHWNGDRQRPSCASPLRSIHEFTITFVPSLPNFPRQECSISWYVDEVVRVVLKLCSLLIREFTRAQMDVVTHGLGRMAMRAVDAGGPSALDDVLVA